MKRIVLLIVLAGFAGGIGFILQGNSKAAVARGVLSFKINKLIAEWNDQNIPAGSRKVTMVVSDTEQKDPVENLELLDSLGGGAEPSGWGGDMSHAERGPSAFKKFSDKMNRTFFRGSLGVVKNTEFAGEFAGEPDTLLWCHRGEETVTQDEMVREFVKAIIKASDAGAEISIITHGPAGAAALKAISSLKDVNRAGRGVYVRRLVAVDMNRARLQSLDPAFFRNYSRTRNLIEWVNIWQPPSGGGPRNVEIFSPASDGVKYSSFEIYKALGVREHAYVRELARLAKELVQGFPAMEQALAYWTQTAIGAAVEKKPEAAPAQPARDEEYNGVVKLKNNTPRATGGRKTR
ncbi:MAG TPA: hypothetical protein DCZ92_14890 [Elusimicrobia bacterium]|nr:MAG: hypothetical protein A2016_03630 [Elusimicrobia bacterium GWF2_62_30]HBA62069.1 hypothetical protein [Elusimicrobiota bacterium]